MFSPFTITVTHPDGKVLIVNVSDSHELQDELSALENKYPNSLITHTAILK